MRTFGIELENLVKVQQGRGVEIADNDFLLAPAGLLPPPRIEGRVTAVRLEAGKIEQISAARPGRVGRSALHPSDPSARNYMFYRGKILRFGKLTMVDADLQIVDADPSDPFDFYLAHLNEQLVAGQSRNQAGLRPAYGDARLRRPRETDFGRREGAVSQLEALSCATSCSAHLISLLRSSPVALLASCTPVFEIGGRMRRQGAARLSWCRAVMADRRSSRWKGAEGNHGRN